MLWIETLLLSWCKYSYKFRCKLAVCISEISSMAESKPNREEDLTCPICVETFRTPLTLPCQHSFCKDCISLYIDKAKSGQAEESSSSRGGARGVVHQVISCPVCREPARLGSDGVNSLPVNCRLSEAVEEFSSEVEVKDNTLWCSVCDENNEAEAVKFCTTCRLFYCEDCLAWFHPMRGGFKCHSLISPQENLTRTAPEAQGKADEGSKLKSSCSSHHQPLSIYCEPCQAVICVECVVEHAGHAVRDIQSAADRDKVRELIRGEIGWPCCQRRLYIGHSCASRSLTWSSTLEPALSFQCVKPQKLVSSDLSVTFESSLWCMKNEAATLRITQMKRLPPPPHPPWTASDLSLLPVLKSLVNYCRAFLYSPLIPLCLCWLSLNQVACLECFVLWFHG